MAIGLDPKQLVLNDPVTHSEGHIHQRGVLGDGEEGKFGDGEDGVANQERR